MQSATCRGYADTVNHLFLLRDFQSPTNFDDKENMAATIVHNLRREEDTATQRSPLTSEIFAELKRISKGSPEDSPKQIVFNMVSFGRITVPRANEYVQKTQSKVEVHTYPSGKEAIKAFVGDDFDFFDKNKRKIRVFNESTLEKVCSMKVKWKIQRNC